MREAPKGRFQLSSGDGRKGWETPGKAYTRTAQFEGLSAEASYLLPKAGGLVLGMVK